MCSPKNRQQNRKYGKKPAASTPKTYENENKSMQWCSYNLHTRLIQSVRKSWNLIARRIEKEERRREKKHLERISLFRAIRNPFDGEFANFECYVRLSFGVSFTDLFNIYIYELLYAFMVIFGQMHTEIKTAGARDLDSIFCSYCALQISVHLLQFCQVSISTLV